jgi:hypothetical protein
MSYVYTHCRDNTGRPIHSGRRKASDWRRAMYTARVFIRGRLSGLLMLAIVDFAHARPL